MRKYLPSSDDLSSIVFFSGECDLGADTFKVMRWRVNTDQLDDLRSNILKKDKGCGAIAATHFTYNKNKKTL